MRKVALIFFFGYLSTPSISYCGDEFQRVYYKDIRCTLSEKYVYQNYSIFVKSLNRTCSTITFIVTAKKPINHIFVRGSTMPRIFLRLQFQAYSRLFYKYGTIYREVLTMPKTDFCRALNFWMQDGFLDNKLIALMLKVTFDSLPPNVLHRCPYSVRLTRVSVSKQLSTQYSESYDICVSILLIFQGVNVTRVFMDTSSVAQIFPSGDYKVIGGAINHKNESLVRCVGYGSLITPDTQTFG